MTHYKGSCHCGAITFEFDHGPINTGIRCNCSICRRKGAVMSDFALSPEELHIEVRDENLSLYQFDSKVAKHFFCKTCGIYPFHETLRKPGYYRVNLGCIDDVDTFHLDNVNVFDGKNLL